MLGIAGRSSYIVTDCFYLGLFLASILVHNSKGPFERAPRWLWLRLLDGALPNMASKSSSRCRSWDTLGSWSSKYWLYTAPLCVRAMQFAISSRAVLPTQRRALHVLLLLLSHPWRFQRKKKENQSPTAVTRPRVHEVSQKGAKIEEKSCTASLQQLLVKLMWAKNADKEPFGQMIYRRHRLRLRSLLRSCSLRESGAGAIFKEAQPLPNGA